MTTNSTLLLLHVHSYTHNWEVHTGHFLVATVSCFVGYKPFMILKWSIVLVTSNSTSKTFGKYLRFTTLQM